MNDLLHDIPILLLTGTILLLMFVANEVGYRLGLRMNEDEKARNAGGTIKGTILGLVALLLAFCFSLSSSRHDARQRVVLEEANTIGTCKLRAGFLSEPYRSQYRATLKQMVDTRLASRSDNLAAHERERLTREMDTLAQRLWNITEAAVLKDPSPVRLSLLVQATNELIDLQTTRGWLIRNHVPRPVMMLLAIMILISGLVLGHYSGQAGRRQWFLWSLMNLLTVMTVHVILDFDRPRRGLIQVDHVPLLEVQASFGSPE